MPYLVPLKPRCFRAQADDGADADLLRCVSARREDGENLHNEFIQGLRVLEGSVAVVEHIDRVHLPWEEGYNKDDPDNLGGV